MHRDLGFPSGILFAGVALCLAGCAGSGAEKKHTIAQLQYTKQRLSQSLVEATNREAKLKSRVNELEIRNKALRREVDGTESRLRIASEKLEVLQKEHRDLRESVRLNQDQAMVLENKLSKARSIASSTAVELADLRVQNEDLQRKVKALRARNTKIVTERDALAKEVEEVRAALARNRAVIRSLTEGGKDREKTRIATLLEKVERLEREKSLLEERVREAARRSAVENPNATASGPPVVVAAGASDFGPVFKARFAQLVNGQLSWDAFDFTVLGAAALVFIALIWALVRRIQRWRMTVAIEALRDQVEELERQLARSKGRGPSEGRVGTRRGTSAVRASSRGFSAVISRSAVETEPEEEAGVEKEPESADTVDPVADYADADDADDTDDDTEDDDAEDNAPTMMLEPLESTEPDGERGSRRVIGARTWQDDGPKSDGEELANTQIIPSVSEKELEDETPGDERDERELLAELKAAINRKCDELVQ